jgi:hypothetical protein
MNEFTLITYIIELLINVEAHSDTVALTDSLLFISQFMYLRLNIKIIVQYCMQL